MARIIEIVAKIMQIMVKTMEMMARIMEVMAKTMEPDNLSRESRAEEWLQRLQVHLWFEGQQSKKESLKETKVSLSSLLLTDLI